MKVSPVFAGILVLLAFVTFCPIIVTGPLAWLCGILYISYDTFLLALVSHRVRKVLKKRSPSARAASTPSLAVLIAARNEAAVLPLCLSALARQTDRPDQIYVVDDGSTDQTVELLKSFREVLLHSKPQSGKADSLNQVWPKVNAQVIVTIDADTILEPDAIAAIRRAFANEPHLAATGGILVPRCTSGKGKLFEIFQRYEYVRAFLSRRAWMENESLLLVSGAFAAYRKDVLEKVGGYDPTCLVEDYELIHRIHRYAFENRETLKVQVLVDARAETDAPDTLAKFLRQRQRWFAGFLQTQFKNSDMIGNRLYGPVGRVMLPIKAADTLQPIYGLVSVGLLLAFWLRSGRIHPVILSIIAGKIALDLVFHFWSVALYHRWQGRKATVKTWTMAAFATLTEPFSFQILRHFGAFLGWIGFLRGKIDWTPQRQITILAASADK